MLLVGAGLLLRSFRNLLEVELGFRPENVDRRPRVPPSRPLRRSAQEPRVLPQLAERVSGLPGVRAVGLSSSAPFSDGDNQQIFMIKGREPAPGEPDLVASVKDVTPGYFAAVGTPILRGRGLEETDGSSSPPSRSWTTTLARRSGRTATRWASRSGCGDKHHHEPLAHDRGVAASIKHGDLRDDPDRYVYLPLAQSASSSMDLVVRTASDPVALTDAIRREVRSVDPRCPSTTCTRSRMRSRAPWRRVE